MRKSSLITATLAALLALPYTGCSGGLGTSQQPTPSGSPQLVHGPLGGGPSMAPKKSEPGLWDRMSGAVKTAFTREEVRADGNKMAPGDPTSLATEVDVNAALFVSLGSVREQSGDFDSAAEMYAKAIEVEPKSRDALLAYAHLLDRQGKLTEAEGLYRKAVQHHPLDTACLNDLGLCCARQGRMADGAEFLERAVKLNPEKKLYRNNLATMLVDIGRTDEALSHLKAVHGEAVAEYNLGYLLVQKEDYSAAQVHFAKATALDPDFTAAQRQMEQLAARGVPAASVAQSEAAPVVRPSHATALQTNAAEPDLLFPQRLPAVESDPYFPPSRSY